MKNKELPIVYEIYDYLKENAVGKNNKKTSNDLIKKFNLNNDCELRKYIRLIRDNEYFQKPICSLTGKKDNGYYIADSIPDLIKNLKHQKQRHLNGLIRVNKQLKKAKLNNQIRFRLFGKEKEIFESVRNK